MTFSNKIGSLRSTRRQHGFTLLELILVLLILSSLAVVTLNFVDLQDGQQRFSDTQRRISLLQTAILGFDQPVYNNQKRLSGFVNDNGRLPGQDQLMEAPSDWLTQQMVTPILDGACVNTQLSKGHRGNYLRRSQRDSSNNITDAWGNEWQKGASFWPEGNIALDDGITIASYGQDNAVNGDGLDQDITNVISPSDYVVTTPENWAITVEQTKLPRGECIVRDADGDGSDDDDVSCFDAINEIDTSTAYTNLRLSVLVFQNSAETENCKVFIENDESKDTVVDVGGSWSSQKKESPDTPSEDDDVVGRSAFSEVSLTIEPSMATPPVEPAIQELESTVFTFDQVIKLPLGRHLVVLHKDDVKVDASTDTERLEAYNKINIVRVDTLNANGDLITGQDSRRPLYGYIDVFEGVDLPNPLTVELF